MSDLVADKPISTSMGDYLKAIWSVAGAGSASTNELSEHLGVSPASVSSMLLRLKKMGFADYEPYHGASLTESGRMEALRLVRRHRLIETFLLEHLGYSWQEVHEEAESLEHAVSDKFTERLAEHLGHPRHDPHGAPIPAASGALPSTAAYPLARAQVGSRIRVSQIGDESVPTLAYLEERGLVPGRLLVVEEVRPLDGVVTVRDEDGVVHSLGGRLANAILVQNSS